MQYMFLIYDDESDSEHMTPEIFGEYAKFSEDVRKSGAIRAGAALQSTATATTVRVRDGERLTTDGPFAETKEQLGGYYVLDCKDLDEALELAAKIPSARYGSIEVRPVHEMGQE